MTSIIAKTSSNSSIFIGCIYLIEHNEKKVVFFLNCSDSGEKAVSDSDLQSTFSHNNGITKLLEKLLHT